MGKRLDLHEVLCDLLGAKNVYFQPPENLKMVYPCIVYERSKINTHFADNDPYAHTKQYTLTIIERDPDSQIPDKLAKLSRCSFDRRFTTDNLHHDVFKIYY